MMTLNSTKRILLASGISLVICSGTAFAVFSKATAGSAENESTCRTCVSQAASLFASNQLDKAVAMLRQSSAGCPRNSQLHLLLSTILIRQGDKALPEAEKEAGLACAAQPDSQGAHLQYANTLLLGKKYAQSAAEFETVASLNPGSYEAWSALADLYKRLRQDDDAAKAAEKAALLEPTSQTVRLSVLQNLKRQGRFAQAKKELKKLLASSENVPEFEQALAVEALQIGDYDDAITASQHVIKAYPESRGPLRGLFLAQFLKRQYSDALLSADKILAEKSKPLDILAFRSICRLQKGDLAGAASDLKSAQAIDAYSGYVSLSDGMIKLANGDFEEAADALNLATDADTRGQEADKIPQSLAHLALSRLKRKEGQFAEAVQEAHAASNNDKRFQAQALALESRAVLNDPKKADALAQAGKLAQDAAALDAEDPEVILAQAFVALRSAKFDEAKKSADRAAGVAPADADCKLILAVLAQQGGGTSGKMEDLEKGRKSDPELDLELKRLNLGNNRAGSGAENGK